MRAIIIALLSTLSFLKVEAQECTSQNDSFYVFFLQYTYSNGNPSASYFLVRNLESLKSLHGIETQKDFLCQWYSENIIFSDPSLTIDHFQKCYNFKTKAEQNKFYQDLTRKIDLLNKRYVTVLTKKCKEGSTVQISCVKLTGCFWVLDKENVFSGQVYAQQCPHSKGEYNLKNIKVAKKINNEEKEKIASLME